MKIGHGPGKQKKDLHARLTDCHDRIRHFTALARKLAGATDVPPTEIADAAAAVHRYFTEALPRHVADEEQSLLPRLRGRSPALDAALATVEAEHVEHDPDVAALVGLTATLRDWPERHGSLAGELAEVAARLDAAFSTHLEAEEAHVFPALRRHLSPDDEAAILSEMAARRDKIGS